MLKQECPLPSTEYVPLAIEKVTCKTIYNTVLNHQHFLLQLQREDSLTATLSFKKGKLTNQMWFTVVCRCTLINNDMHHHSGQNVVDSQGAPEWVHNKFRPL